MDCTIYVVKMGADQLCGAADPATSLCFCICKKQISSSPGSYSFLMSVMCLDDIYIGMVSQTG